MRTRRWPLAASLCLSAVVTMTVSVARADEEPPPVSVSPAPPAPSMAAPSPKEAPPQEDTTACDYRVPMIATDLALMGAFTGSWTLGRADAIPAGAAVAGAIGSYAGFVASGAIYHALFDIRKKTALSIVVRSLAPAVFGVAVAGAVHDSESSKCRKESVPEDDCNHDGTQTGALIGALIGMLGATVAETTILVPDGQKPAPSPKSAALSIAPSVATTRGGGQVGLAGTF